MSAELGQLAAALAKAQSEFGTVTRDKHVTITTKTGGKYEFDYAPLESILAATRTPLTTNGLALVQTLDDGALVTSLYHESGAVISGRIDLPHTEDIKGLGSAITYLRRYAVQAMLGIAAEDDDDGSRSIGDTIEAPAAKAGGESTELLGNLQKTGTLGKGTATNYHGEWREAVDGHAIGLRMKLDGEDRDIPQVLIKGTIGEALYLSGAELVGSRVTVKGKLYSVSAKGRTTYYRLIVGDHPDTEFVSSAEWRVPALPPETPLEAPSVPLFSEAEQKAIDDDIDAVLG